MVIDDVKDRIKQLMIISCNFFDWYQAVYPVGRWYVSPSSQQYEWFNEEFGDSIMILDADGDIGC